MSGWTAKRFWKSATVEPVEGGFGVFLDGRAVKTPAKATLIVPTRAMAEAIAAEWDAQVEKIDPLTMPVTRGANAAIDKVRTQFDEVAEMVAAYGGTDLLCYRADAQPRLRALQDAAWDPLLDWAQNDLGARLTVTGGIIPVPQDAEALRVLHGHVAAMDAFELAALHDLVGISGSLILGLAVARGHLDGAQAWDLSRIDETFQIEEWGADEEAVEHAALKRDQLLAAERFWQLTHA